MGECGAPGGRPPSRDHRHHLLICSCAEEHVGPVAERIFGLLEGAARVALTGPLDLALGLLVDALVVLLLPGRRLFLVWLPIVHVKGRKSSKIKGK